MSNERSPSPSLGQGLSTTSSLYISGELQSGLQLYLPEDRVVEIRVLDGTTIGDYRAATHCGFFDNRNSVVELMDTLASYGGVYVTLNPVNPALLSRARNRLKRAGRGDGTGDGDVLRRKRLLIDLDAVRPSGISSTDEEHEAALTKGRQIIADLETRGWPAPAFIDSGNGSHLVYAVDLASDDGGTVQRCLQALADRFDDNSVHVDTSVHNPARIVKLPGTWAFKGDNTDVRPWRLCVVLDSPEVLQTVSTERLEELAAAAPSAERRPRTSTANRGQGRSFELEPFIENNQFDVADPCPWRDGGRIWTFRRSPMCDHHDRSAYIGQHSNGAIFAGCHHDSCDWTWAELRQRYDAGPGGNTDSQSYEGHRYHLTDTGNAERFVQHHGDRLRYCSKWNKWLAFDGSRWCIDDRGQSMTMAIATVRAMYDDLSSIADSTARRRHFKHAAESESHPRLSAMIKIAKSMTPIRHEELDRDPWLLNCPNGTLDLQTGELREHRRNDFITKVCPTHYVADAEAPVFEIALDAILGGEADVIAFTQRLFGYTLTGLTVEHILPILYGLGSNGKSTLLEAILATLGPDYAMKAASDLLISKRYSDHPTKFADLFGKRFVACVETQDGDRLDEVLVKELTGGDRIRARRMREDFWEFTPTHKVVLSTNHRPEVQGVDHAIWRRLALVPFNVRFWDPDRGETGPDELRVNKQLGQQLRAEAEGILAWMVRGCLAWRRDGLRVPESVRVATSEYRAEQDVIDRFIREVCHTGSVTQYRERGADLYEQYRRWCVAEGETQVTNTKFGRLLREKGFETTRSNGIWRTGIAIRHF